jgi:hypothetical protein
MEMNPELAELAAKHGMVLQKEVTNKEDSKWRHVTINDNTYSVRMMGAIKGAGLAIKLKGIALPLIGKYADGVNQEDDLLNPPQTFTDMAQILTYQLENADVGDIIFSKLLKDIKFNGELVTDIDDIFSANYGDLIELVAFTIKENFGSFFTGSGLMRSVQEKMQKLLGSSQETTQETTEQE